MSEKTFRPGGVLAGQTFTLDDHFLRYKYVYGKFASVPRKSIEAVVVEPKRMGKSYLKILGHGAELANIEMPHPWCEKTQLWLINELGL